MDALPAQGVSRGRDSLHSESSYKRLERGRFVFQQQVNQQAQSVQIEEHELAMLLEGIDMNKTRRSVRWNPPRLSKNHLMSKENRI